MAGLEINPNEVKNMSETKTVGKKIPAFNIVIQRDEATKGERIQVARISLWENDSETVNAPQFTGSSDSPYGKLRVAMWEFKGKSKVELLKEEGYALSPLFEQAR